MKNNMWGNNPYPSKTPEYGKFWRLVNIERKTREEALEVMKEWRPRGKNGYRRPVATEDPLGGVTDPPVVKDLSSSPTTPATNNDLTRIADSLEKIAILLGEINGSLHKICDQGSPGIMRTVDIGKKFEAKPPQNTTTNPTESKITTNGWAVGTKVKQVSTGDIGTITRVMPGRCEVAVRFLVGTKTLHIDQLVGVK